MLYLLIIYALGDNPNGPGLKHLRAKTSLAERVILLPDLSVG